MVGAKVEDRACYYPWKRLSLQKVNLYAASRVI
jgi:hypothetical protein